MMSDKFVCPLCKSSKIKQYPVGGVDADYRIDCDRCGEYFYTDEFVDDTEPLFFEKNGYILSGLSRELYELGQKSVTFTYKDKDKFLKHYLVPDVSDIDEKITKFLLNMKNRTEWYGKMVTYHPSLDYPIAYAKNKKEFLNLLQLLEEAGYIKIDPQSPADDLIDSMLDMTDMTLTAEGWRKVSDLEKKNKDSEQGFIAIWFDPEGSMDTSITSIEEAIRETGFKSMCIRDEHFSERIMDKALGEIRKSRFVVIDLTGARSSVFFEAGFAFGLNVESVYVYKKGEETKSPLEFYVKHYQCHSYETPEQLKEIVRNAVSARIMR